MLKLASIVLVGVIAILGVYLQQTIKIIGVFRETYEKGDCKPLQQGFCEKAVSFEDKIYTICSTFKKRSKYYPTLHVLNEDTEQQDELFVYDGKLRKIEIDFKKGLLVNGFDIKKFGSKALLVATNVFNHTVEEFELGETLVHKRTIKSDLFHALDDVAIAGKGQYVITNDHSVQAADNLFYRVLEDTFSLPNGNVILFKDEKASVIIGHVPNANSLLLKYEEGLQLWVSSPSEGAIFRYNFNPDENDYTNIDRIKLDFPPDNLSQHKGVVHIAGMVKAFNTLQGILKLRSGDEDAYFKTDLTSQIVEIKNETSNQKFFGNLFSKTIKAQSRKLHFSTGAVKYENGYLVTGFNTLMFCTE
eukprot:NODE_55_length_29507_cov_0.809712.p8 type:complete len:360 gc:universal NODE_55_length_29507_cov_0.809712:16678-17757(+)